MEYREYRCPSCNEIMQVPVGRRKIICMFCGQDVVILDENGNGDSTTADAGYYLESIEADCRRIFARMEDYNALFTKQAYKEAFAGFREEFRRELDGIYSAALLQKESPDEAGDLIDRISQKFAGTASSILLSSPKRGERQLANEKANMYMVSYFIPAINEYGKALMEEVAESFCDAWRDAFPMGNIGVSDHATIAGGFRTGIFGLFKGRF